MKAIAAVLAAAALLGCHAASAAPGRVPDFDHVIVVVFEKKETGNVLGNPDAPTFNLYARVHARVTP